MVTVFSCVPCAAARDTCGCRAIPSSKTRRFRANARSRDPWKALGTRAGGVSSTSHGHRHLPSASFFPFAAPDLSGDLLSSAAQFALRTYLVECGSVDVTVDANAGSLFQGTVREVVIEGNNWRSRKDLTCVSLRMAVGEAALDPGALLTERLIKLKKPSDGNAQVVFSETDFGNFLTHPLVERATKEWAEEDGVQDTKKKFRFDKETTTKNGCVVFFGQWEDSERKVNKLRYIMCPSLNAPGFVDVTTTCVSGECDEREIETAERAMAVFFQTLVVDLSGARLSYRSMLIENDRISLDLALEVVSFPPPQSLGMI